MLLEVTKRKAAYKFKKKWSFGGPIKERIIAVGKWHIFPTALAYPTTSAYKKRRQKISAAQAIDRLVVFHKVCTGAQYVDLRENHSTD